MLKSLAIVVAGLIILASPCLAQAQKKQKPDATPAITKYNEMEKGELQGELKRLQKEILVAERTAKQFKQQAAEAAKAYKSASDEEKPDALFRLLEVRVTEKKASRPSRQIKREFQAAQKAYSDLLMNE